MINFIYEAIVKLEFKQSHHCSFVTTKRKKILYYEALNILENRIRQFYGSLKRIGILRCNKNSP